MTSDIKSFVSYLRDVKKTSRNTEISYQRDLMQLKSFLEDKGITEVEKVTKTSLNSYILFLEKEGKATTTISRELASMKAFFNFMFKEGRIRKDPAELLKAPKIEKKAPVILSVNEVNALLDQPGMTTSKEIRDKAMLELLYATGIRVSELIGLELSDLNMQVGYITCRDGQKERMVPFGKPAKQALSVYLEKGRSQLLKGKESQWLFTNCSGKAMSRQGFWKLIKQEDYQVLRGKGRYPGRYNPSYPAPFLCGPSDSGRRRYPCGPGHAGPFRFHHHPYVRCLFRQYGGRNLPGGFAQKIGKYGNDV